MFAADSENRTSAPAPVRLEEQLIARRFAFPAYSRTLGFANAVAWIAITEGHHPELVVNYGTCDVKWSTHAVNGLSDNDFICAAKVDRLAADSE